MSDAVYTIKLPQFEGPFDLLLFFIERDELDIYNIPIYTITNDFLDYIRQSERMNIDVSSEFILMASTLMRIKAKMLLPRKELDDQGNEIDPRQELVERLIEYRRYKEVLVEMRQLEERQQHRNERGSLTTELEQLAAKALVDAEMQHLTLFKLFRAYQQVMERYHKNNLKIVHTVVRYNYSLEERRDYLVQLVQREQSCDFQRIFEYCENRLHAIFTFLALLELLQQGLVLIEQGEGFNQFKILTSSAAGN